MSTVTYLVDGMSCGHCAAAVTREVGALPGVAGVEVDLDARTVSVTGAASEAEVATAVAGAGYALAGRA